MAIHDINLSNIGSGGALPIIYVVDNDGTLAGKVFTITDENGLFSHTTTFPSDSNTLKMIADYLGMWTVSYEENGSIFLKNINVDKLGGILVDGNTLGVSWAKGTDAQIVEMIRKADAGEINLNDYWNIGDERVISLSAMEATGVGESHVAQNVTFVLMDTDKYELVTATSGGKTTCNFVVGMKNCLSESGYMHTPSSSSNNWSNCQRHTWCNNIFRNSIPSTIRSIFKQHKVITVTNSDNNPYTISKTYDYFSLFESGEIESNTRSIEVGIEQLEYYKINGMRKGNYSYWLRGKSRYYSGYRYEYFASNYGFITDDGSGGAYGLSMVGCI